MQVTGAGHPSGPAAPMGHAIWSELQVVSGGQLSPMAETASKRTTNNFIFDAKKDRQK